MFKKNALLVVFFACTATSVFAQKPEKPTSVDGPSLTPPATASSDSVSVTIIMRHQQDKNLTEIRRKLEANGFWDLFPPADCRVVSWQIVMGVGHIILIKLPVNSVRRLNLAIENGAWGAYDTEIYLTYDYLPVWQDYVEKRREAKEDKD